MKLLADTHILLWAAFKSSKLSAAANALLSDQENELFFSPASIWEIAVKSALGRANFQIDATDIHQGLRKSGYIELAILSVHGIAASVLPPLHKDPFDRILIAQTTVEDMLLITSDPIVAKYQGPIRLV